MQTRTYRLNDDGWSVAGCSIIYAPRGQAGEYAKLATNPYRGCGHKCAYCYVPAVLHISRAEFDAGATPRTNFLCLRLCDLVLFGHLAEEVGQIRIVRDDLVEKRIKRSGVVRRQRRNRVKRSQDDPLLCFAQIDILHRHTRHTTAQRQSDTRMSIDQPARRAVDGHRRDPADFIQRAHERRYLTLRVPAIVAGVGCQRRRVYVAMAHDAVAPIFP